jgi:ribonucleoside-diphosphate reductase alpha chain
MQWVNKSDKEKTILVDNLLLASDNMIGLAFYPVKDGELANKTRRPIGVGISNYANYLASQKAIFTDEIAKELTHSLMEDVTYFILKGSTKLAKLRKPYSYFKDSEWVKGILPMDLHPVKYKYKLKHNWSKLREDIKQDGVRFSYHFAQAPTASSSIVIGVTESIEPIRDLFSTREGTYTLPHIVPNLKGNRKYYQNAFDIPTKVIYDLASIRQKFLDQSQALNTYYRTTDSAYEIIRDIIYAESIGLKTLYYLVPKKAETDGESCESCGS